MASALSSSSTNYDVFISFRGEDTRDNFTSHLFAALGRRNVKIFDDREMRRGDVISPTLSNAIEASKISVIIFSEDYASSKWCLNELLQILECKEKNGQIVIPVFYKVDPSDVSNQSGSFGDAFVRRERQELPQNVEKWRGGLTKASRLPGLDSKEFRNAGSTAGARISKFLAWIDLFLQLMADMFLVFLILLMYYLILGQDFASSKYFLENSVMLPYFPCALGLSFVKQSKT